MEGGIMGAETNAWIVQVIVKHLSQSLNGNEENPIFRSNVGQIIPKTKKCGGGGGVGGVAIPTDRPTDYLHKHS